MDEIYGKKRTIEPESLLSTETLEEPTPTTSDATPSTSRTIDKENNPPTKSTKRNRTLLTRNTKHHIRKYKKG